ncbi:MAG: protein kinase [Actinomycetota bacterium]
MPEETGPLDLPVRVGRYVLGPVLGVGGFAVVVRARDELLDADVAVKILTPRHAGDPEVRERFVREARMLRRVRSPAVVTVHDVGETKDGRPYLVMDLAGGGVLQDRLAAPWRDTRDLEHLVRTLADGLGALHAAGVVHRDIKPANLLVMSDRRAKPGAGAPAVLTEGERLVIGDLGLAKDQLASSYGPTMIGGTPGFQAPEQQEVGGRIEPRTDVYAATAVLWVALSGEAPPAPEQLPVKLLDLPERWRPVLRRGMAPDAVDRFGSMGEWVEAVLGVEDFAGLQGRGPSVAGARLEAALPYKGLAAFQPGDAVLFFGRSELVDQLVARLGQCAVLVIGGPSGSGKSSLLRAGLLPAIAGGALPGSKSWPICLLTPAERPLVSLLDAAAAVAGVSNLPSVEDLKADPAALGSALPDQTVIAVDQLEELFTLCSDSGDRQAFLEVLEGFSRGARPRARVVMAIRADFYGSCAAFRWLAGTINRSHLLVGPMSRAQLQEAIVGPARRVGLNLEGALVERVLSDAGDDAGALPLVSHALVETWLRREDERLTLAGYEAAGGVTGAIGRTADEVWEALDDSQKLCARRLLPQLVHPGDGAADTKRLMSWREVGKDAAAREVVSRFAQSRLLTVDDKGVQLAHEALLRSWGRLASWVEESRDDLRQGERLAEAAREWDRQGRLEDLLYRGVPLAAALQWRERRAGAVEGLTDTFVEAAAEAETRREEAKRLRTERDRRTRKRVLVGLSGLTTVALVASAVAGVALLRSREANLLASEQLARGLAASAVDLAGANPFLATMLAAEAMVRTDPPLAEARDALVRSRLALGGSRLVPYGDPIPVGDAVALAVGPDGERAATGNRDGSVDLWDLGSTNRLAGLNGPSSGVHGLAFGPGGDRLIAATADGNLWRWELGSPADAAEGEVVAETGSIVWGVAAAPSSSLVAATTTSGQVWLIDAASGEQVGVLDPAAGELLSVAFSPDGALLVAGSARGEVFVWDLADRSLKYGPVAAHSSDVWELVPTETPEGPRFATVSSDGTARLWDLGTGEAVSGGPFEADGHAIPIGVRGATFGPGSDVLTLGGPDGALYSWSMSKRQVLEVGEAMHRDRITQAGRSAGGETLVTLADDRTIQVWTERARPGAVVEIGDVGARPRSMAVSPDGRVLAVGTGAGDVVLLGEDGDRRPGFGGHSGAVSAVGFAGPSMLITGDEEGVLRLWNADSGELLSERPAGGGAIRTMAVGGGRSLLVTGDEGGVVGFWDAGSLEPITEAARLGSAITDVAIGGSAPTVAASTRRGEVGLWDGAGRNIGEPLRVIDDTVWGVALHPAAQILAAAGADEVLSLWSLEDSAAPERTRELGSHRLGALDVVFVDPGTVAVGTGEGLVQLWDAASGQRIGPGLEVAAGPVRYVVGSQGTVWAAADSGKVVRIDVLDVRAACSAAASSFDARQRERLLAGRPSVACG